MTYLHVSRSAAAIAGVLLLSLTGILLAQSTATVQGTVSDQAGAAVPNAAVSARNQATGEERATQTDSTGAYLLPSLPRGTYRIEAKAPGLQTVAAANVVLEVGRTIVQDFSLKVASTSEVVEVTATAPVIESRSVSVGQVIDNRTVQEIPLNGRHFVDLGLLIPGSVTPPQSGFLTAPLRGQGSLAFNTAGNREDTANFMINGINLNDMAQNQITFQPTINTVEEFKVDNSTYAAEYGRNSGAIVNIATKSGTNSWHGEAFEYLRNNAMDARNYFNRTPAPQSQFNRNQYGGAVGGPIWKDRTFFFASYEGLRQKQGVTINSAVLTPVQRDAAAAIGNPTVVKLLPYIPLPNSGNSLFVGSASAPVDIDQGTINVSHNFSTKDRINGYYAIQEDLRGEPTLQGNTIPGFGDSRQARRQLFTFNETHVFSPSLVNEARLGINRIHITFAPNTPLNPADFGINNGVTTAIGLPQMTIRDIGMNFGGPSGFPQGRGDYTAVFSDTASWLRGKHTIKFGGEYRRFNNNNFGNDPGTFAFNNVADFNIGRAASFTVNTVPTSSRIYVNALGLFISDSWKATRRLTLDLGFRYDWNGTPTEAQNRFVVFDQARDMLIQAGVDNSGVYNQNALNFEPRVGLALDMFGNGKTVLRAAYAIQVDQPVSNLVMGLASNPPFANPVAFNGPGTVTFADALNAAAAAGSLAPASVNNEFRNARVQSYNFNVQHQLSDTIGLMAGYFGSEGTHLRISRNINQFIDGVRPYRALSPDSPILPGKLLGNINMNDSGGNSNYNALWVTATKRFSRGIQFNTSYTYSKSLDYNSLNSQATVVQDSFNIRNDRGLSDYDARQRWVVSAIYEFPFKANRFVQGWQLTGIYQIQSGNPFNVITTNGALTGITSVRPDLLAPVSTAYNSAFNGNVQYFPSNACALPTDGCSFLIANRLGNLGRNVLIGPGFDNLDLSLLKNTMITEKVNLQFRADVFNLANHPNLGQPNRSASVVAGNTFGQISSTRFPVGDSGSSRQIQLALKLIF
jgi:hypothetical protein